MATKKRKSSAAKKSSRRASTAKKSATKKSAGRKATAKKAATRKSAAKKRTARKSTAKKSAARKSTAKKSPARKSAAKKSSSGVRGGKKAASASTPRTARLAVPREPPAPVEVSIVAVAWDEPEVESASFEEQVETSSAGLLPLAPEHAPVDELTSSGNELLDIFQRYDRNRTGAIERAEFARLLEALGQNITDEELEIALDIVDTDNTGQISWSEFKTWWNSR
ncbi:EF-hand domain-containing protein [Myxococcus stipitatus]|uniref:EF-hand domain-containing protein n=1 Tax=Myxococcus stipitatus TaxID=83455 RepID=UPI0030D005D4